MKKFVAVLAVSAMVTTAAFAQASIGGMIGVRGDIINNSGNTGNTPEFALPGDGMDGLGRGWGHEGRLHLSIGNGEGTAGAGGRMWFNELNPPADLHAWVWWQPLESLRVFAGRDPWAVYGLTEIVGWGYLANNAEDWLLGWGSPGAYHYQAPAQTGALGRATGFYGGVGFNNMSVQITPMAVDGLEIIYALPFVSLGPNWVDNGLLSSHFGFRYSIPGVGRLALTWQGDAAGFNASDFFLSFLVTAIQGMQINIGAHFDLTGEDSDPLLNLGLGFLYSSGQLRFTARLAAALLDPNMTRIGLGIHPSYDVGLVRLALNAGMQANIPDQGETVVSWHATPYIMRMIASPTRIYAGFSLASRGTENADVIWRIPVGIQFEW